MASPFPPRTLVFKIVTCTVFIMVHNTAYPTPSGYDARKHVKLLRPVVYVILPASHAKKTNTPWSHEGPTGASFLVILTWTQKLPPLSNTWISWKKAEVYWGEGGFLSVPAFPWKNTRMPFPVFIRFGCNLFQIYFSFIFKDYLMPITWWLLKVYIVSFLSFL